MQLFTAGLRPLPALGNSRRTPPAGSNRLCFRNCLKLNSAIAQVSPSCVFPAAKLAFLPESFRTHGGVLRDTAVLAKRIFGRTSSIYWLASARVVMVLNRAIFAGRSSSGDRAKSDRSATNNNPGKFPSLTDSLGRVTGATSITREDRVAMVRSNETGSQPLTPDCTGAGSEEGVSLLGLDSDTSDTRL